MSFVYEWGCLYGIVLGNIYTFAFAILKSIRMWDKQANKKKKKNYKQRKQEKKRSKKKTKKTSQLSSALPFSKVV